jgi:hypothetical protein
MLNLPGFLSRRQSIPCTITGENCNGKIDGFHPVPSRNGGGIWAALWAWPLIFGQFGGKVNFGLLGFAVL